MVNQTKKSKKAFFIGVPITTVAIIYPIIYVVLKFISFNLVKIVMPIIVLLLGISFILKIKISKPNVPYILSKIFNKYIIMFVLLPLTLIFSMDLFYELSVGHVTFSSFLKPIIAHPIPYLIIYIILISFIALLLGN